MKIDKYFVFFQNNLLMIQRITDLMKSIRRENSTKKKGSHMLENDHSKYKLSTNQSEMLLWKISLIAKVEICVRRRKKKQRKEKDKEGNKNTKLIFTEINCCEFVA